MFFALATRREENNFAPRVEGARGGYPFAVG
jgi:hypothetical protein